MTKLIEANHYESRSAELIEAKRLAEDAYKHAAFQLETGTGTQEAVAAAKHHLDNISDQMASLEAAWAASLTARSEAAMEVEREQWRKNRSAVEKALRERELAADTIVKALKTVGDGFARFTSANDAIVSNMRPWMDGKYEDFTFLRDAISSTSNSVEFFIAGELRAKGINFAGIDFGVAKARALNENVVDMVANANSLVASRADRFKPETVHDA